LKLITKETLDFIWTCECFILSKFYSIPYITELIAMQGYLTSQIQIARCMHAHTNWNYVSYAAGLSSSLFSRRTLYGL